jgi:hypothetical protein
MPNPYEEARARIAARRAANPPRSWWDIGKDAIGGVADVTLPSKTLSDYWEGPAYALRHPIDSAKLVGSSLLEGQMDQFRKAGTAPTLSEKIAHGAAGLLPMVGPMAANAGEEIGQGHFARGLGQSAGILGGLALGARASRTPELPIPEPVVEPRPIRGLLPEHTTPRFVAGERGVVDARAANPMDTGAPRPNFGERATVLPQERNQFMGDVDPIIKANYSGTGDPLPPRNVPSSAGIDPFANVQSRAFEALVPDRYKTTPNIQPFEGAPVEQPKPAFYPKTDPNVPGIGDVAPIDPREQPVMTEAPKKVGSGRTARLTSKKNSQGLTVPEMRDTNLAPAADTVKRDMQRTVTDPTRPYAKLGDNDLMTLEARGDAAAIREMVARKRGDTTVDPTPPRPSLGDRLRDERGSVDFTGEKGIPPQDKFKATADAQRGAPEDSMLRLQRAAGGGLLGQLAEHVGDLTHRMSESVTARTRGYEFVKEKVDKTLRWLEHPYGVEKEINENIANNAAYRKVPEADFRQNVQSAMQDYADAHRQVPVHTETQALARDAAIAIGEGRFSDATTALKSLKSSLDQGPEAWVQRANTPLSTEPTFSAGETGAAGPGVGKLNAGRTIKPIDFNAPIIGGDRGNYFHRTVNPTFDTNFANWVNARRATRIEGIIKRREFADLDSKGLQGIHDFQAGLKDGRFKDVGDYFNAKHDELSNSGVKLGFRENYLPQLWNDAPERVFAAQKKLGLSPSFTLDRVLENYQKGIAEGLTPKYKSIGELMGWYEERANKAIADRQFFDHLRETKQILPDGKAPTEWKTLDSDHFPVQKFKTKKNEYVTKNYKAPAPIASAINDYLGEGHGFFRGLADKASITKNIVLSSGIPYTGLNAHGFNILARNVMANGLLKGGAEGVKYLINPKSATRFFDSHIAEAPDAVRHGLTLTTEEHDMGSAGSTHLLREPKTKVGAVLNKGLNYVLEKQGKMFEDPLFQNIIPALKLKHWRGLADDMIKGGMDETAAKKSAADATNSLYGGINWEAMQRSRDLQNLLRSVVLAPDWFETQYRIGKGMGNTVRSASRGDAFDPRGQAYKRVAANLIASYVAADVVNYGINGKHMWDNDPGHALDIKAGSVGGKTRYIRPFGTAADFARLPFDAIAGAAKGDLSSTSAILKNRRSTIAKGASNLLMNTDDFGKPIFGKDDFGRPQPLTTQLGKAGREVADVVTPQYISGAAKYATGQVTSPEEAILGGVEAPVRYSRESTKKQSRYRPVRRRPSR